MTKNSQKEVSLDESTSVKTVALFYGIAVAIATGVFLTEFATTSYGWDPMMVGIALVIALQGALITFLISKFGSILRNTEALLQLHKNSTSE